MALTTSRWIACVAAVFVLVTGATLTADPVEPRGTAVSADEIAPDLERRLVSAARRWEALVRRDTVVARLERSAALPAGQPRLLIDPLLPATHRSVIERAVARQWASLRIGHARVAVVVAVVVDTLPRRDLPGGGRGQVAYDYVIPAGEDAASRCIAIVSLRSRQVVQPGTQRTLTEVATVQRSAPSLLGPCAFFARFGTPGAKIHSWLRSRSYDVVGSARWWTIPADDALAIGERWRVANAGGPPASVFWLSPDAIACTAGKTARCVASLAPDSSDAAIDEGALVMMRTTRDAHWGTMSERYVADLVSVLGPERFERFWRSDLDPDAALRAVGGVPLAVWTHEWASGLLGPQRVGPGLSIAEVVAAMTLAGLSLVLAAWGWSRRQVR